MILTSQQNRLSLCLGAFVIGCLLVGLAHSASTSTAPSTTGSSGSRTNSFLRNGILSNLFRRQTSSNNKNINNNNNNKDNDGSSSNDSSETVDPLTGGRTSSSSSSSSSSKDTEGMTPTEIEAQRFMDSLPNTNGNSQKDPPSSFRERVSESFGLLRDGVSNQFRSMRENWSDTVEDLRDTWTSNSQE